MKSLSNRTKLALGVASAARMSAAFSIRVMIGAGFTAVRLIIFHDSIRQRNNAQTGFTGTFHLIYGSHRFALISSGIILTYE